MYFKVIEEISQELIVLPCILILLLFFVSLAYLFVNFNFSQFTYPTLEDLPGS